MKHLLSMESLRITSILVLLFTCSVSSFPSRPLNERSADLAWQAWLLVDDQNQEKNYDPESLGRKRITPKSVFIAPTFSPETLEPCPSGYRSDSMGRCVKFVQLDEALSLAYLLEKLNDRFGGSDDQASEQEPSGPLQLNIPLDEVETENGNRSSEDVEEDVNVAIVVAPTNGNFNMDDVDKTSAKRDGSRPMGDSGSLGNPDTADFLLKTGNIPSPTIRHEFIPDQTDSSTDIVEEELDNGTEKTPIPESGPEPTTTTQPTVENTSVHVQQALFFREPIENAGDNLNSDHETKNNEEGASLGIVDGDNDDNINRETTTELSSTTFQARDINNAPTEYQEAAKNAPIVSSVHTTNQSQNLVRFPDTDALPPEKKIRFPTEEEEETPNRNRFPTNAGFKNLFYQSLPMQDDPNPKIYANQFRHVHSTQRYIQPDVEEVTPEADFVFKDDDYAKSQRNLGLMDRLQPRIVERAVNASKELRTRERKSTIWSFPQTPLNESSLQQPLVLRFPQRHGSRRLLSASVLHPPKGSYKTYYREMRPEDLKMIFGNSRGKRKGDR